MYIYRVWSVCSCCEHVFKMHSVARFPSHQNMTKNYLMHRRGALNCQKVYCSNTQYISIEEMLIDLPWEDEKGPSSISPTLELFQGQHWGNSWETGWSAYGPSRADIYHRELYCCGFLYCCCINHLQRLKMLFVAASTCGQLAGLLLASLDVARLQCV